MNDKEKCEKLGIMFISTGTILIGFGAFVIMKSKSMFIS